MLLPAGIDPHTHPLGDLAASCAQARRGGTTTLVAFTAPHQGERPAAAYVRARDELLPRATTDVLLHPTVADPERLRVGDLVELYELGARAVKLYLAYSELGMQASERMLYDTLREAAPMGMLVRVHCEHGPSIDRLVEEQIAAGNTGVAGFVASRPPHVEEESVELTLALARRARAPVYLVHLTTRGSLQLVRAARKRGQVVWAEACTHHLLLDDGVYGGPHPERFLIVPPLRPRDDVEALWEAVEDGTLDTVGSDHAVGPYQPPFDFDDFRSLPYSFGGVGLRMPLVLSEGTRRGVPAARLVDLLVRGPARAFRLPVHEDAVRWEPEETWLAQDGPYAGLAVQGSVRVVE